MHAHTATGGDDGDGTYADAYNYARYTAGLNFFALTPHNHLISDATYLNLVSIASTFNVDGSFIAIAGQECFTYDTGHVNVFESNNRVNITSGQWNTFYQTWLPSHPEVAYAQFNHPSASNMFNSFSYNSVGANYMKAVEIQNGPAFSISTTESDTGTNYESEFQSFLNKGWKLAPTANQDNHNRTWGKATPNRTGILANALTKTEILNAFKARRVFATQDKTLAVTFYADDSSHYQGSVYSRVSGNISFTITAWDLQGSSTTGDRISTIRLYGDLNGVGGSVASILTTINLSPSQISTQLVITRSSVPGETYYYVKITQTDTDNAWTAPIWITQLASVDSTPPTFGGITSVIDPGTGNKLNLAWVPASDPTLPITYNLYRSLSSGIYNFNSPVYSGIAGTSITDLGVSNGTTYYYIVRSKDGAGNEDTNTVELSGIPTGTNGSNGTHLVINEFEAKNTEFIEIYNPTDSTINLNSWQITSLSVGTITTFGSVNISANGYTVISSSAKLNNGGDQIFLLSSGLSTVDRVAFGNLGEAPLDPVPNTSIVRIPNGIDSDEEGYDFNLTYQSTPGSANIGSPSNLGDSPIKINEIALNPVNQFELYNTDLISSVNITNWLLSDGDDLQLITGPVIITPGGYYAFSYSSTGSNGGMSQSDNFYLFNQNTVRFDQVGFSGGPVTNSLISTYQRYPDGFGLNDTFNWITADPGGWLVQLPTLPTTNLPVELSDFQAVTITRDE